MERTVSCLWKEPDAARVYRTGISLHSHTSHSQESLQFIGDFLQEQPILRRWLNGQKSNSMRATATPVNLHKAYWTPPLSPVAAILLESEQIERTLGLHRSFVSISDHDTIAAPMALRVMPAMRHVPISVEWTVPFGDAIFHVGVHNLPAAAAESMFAELRSYTEAPSRGRLTDILRWLHTQRDVLVVLNHPYWDLAGIGAERHEMALTALLAEEGERLHALELSGIRSWEENQATRRLAEAFNQMVISGGDRHGTEPNATLNLTQAATFDAFVHEIRRERKGHVLFMPQYRHNNTLRVIETILAVVREYPEYPLGSQRWDERVYHPDRHGVVQPLARLWDKPPAYMGMIFSLLGVLEVVPVQRALRVALRKAQKQFAPAAPGYKEAAR